ncbi:MAG: PKD-like domain-containing protein [Prevotella sp.]|nr:PKD-like domain-containing protein [Prevotella sp.]
MKQFYWLASLFLCLSFCGCNKDELIADGSQSAPSIVFDDESGGIYTVKTGRELTVSPVFKNVEDAIITWTLNGKIVCRGQTYTAVWQDLGEHYVKVTAVNSAGRAEEEIRVDVVELTPPVIDIKIPQEGFKILVDADYEFVAEYVFDDLDGFNIEWFIDNKSVSREKTFVWHPMDLGIYHVMIKASNIDGETIKEFDAEVVKTMPYRIIFPTPSYYQTSTVRYTFVDRPVFLCPYLEYFVNPTFRWTVDGNDVECMEQTYKFTPNHSGEYKITVFVKDGLTGVETVQDVMVVCVEGSEKDRFRPATAESLPTQNKVYEYVPAPGQFIGEETEVYGGWTQADNTLEIANAWAEKRLRENAFVSLGGFGGYVIIGFDHSVPVRDLNYDIAIQGNAFGSSNEPGIVWVMQDVNGNGLPDDEWYELRGSETAKGTTIQNYAVTYYKPSAPRRDVLWTDSEGKEGCVVYNQYHKQDYYYPAWIHENSYTLYGTKIVSNNIMDPSTGYWSNNPYEWGYVDNMGTDNLGGDSYTGSGQRNGFKISNAMFADLSPIKLEYIDFIKVQNCVNATSGALGEISTEVFGFQDLSMLPSKSNIHKKTKNKKQR